MGFSIFLKNTSICKGGIEPATFRLLIGPLYSLKLQPPPTKWRNRTARVKSLILEQQAASTGASQRQQLQDALYQHRPCVSRQWVEYVMRDTLMQCQDCQCDFAKSGGQNIILAVDISAIHRCVHICRCHTDAAMHTQYTIQLCISKIFLRRPLEIFQLCLW